MGNGEVIAKKTYLEKSRRGDQHHERLSKLLDVFVNLRLAHAAAAAAADARRLLEHLDDERPVVGQETAGGDERGDALWAPGEHRGGDEARHAHQEGVVPLERARGGSRIVAAAARGSEVEVRVRREQARELDGAEQVVLDHMLGARAGLAEGLEERELGAPEELRVGIVCAVCDGVSTMMLVEKEN